MHGGRNQVTLLITVFAAVISTAVWYKSAPHGEMRVGTLSLIYWGAALMWFVDAIFDYAHRGSELFNPEPGEMLNDAYLGLSVVALGLVIWTVTLLVSDPRGVLRKKSE